MSNGFFNGLPPITGKDSQNKIVLRTCKYLAYDTYRTVGRFFLSVLVLIIFTGIFRSRRNARVFDWLSCTFNIYLIRPNLLLARKSHDVKQ